jgi:4-hydroxybenzoate polyprenyltransferase
MGKLSEYLSVIRTYQWYKSVWVLFPLVELSSQKLAEVNWQKVLLSVLLVIALSSIVYVMNDLSDIERDRLHPTKKNRPFARGSLTNTEGVRLLVLLFVVVVVLALGIDNAVAWLLSAAFLLGNLGYTKFAKHIPYVEFVAYGMLFPIRMMIGTAVVEGLYFTPGYWFVVSMGVTGLLFFRLFEKKWTDGKGRAVLECYNTNTLTILFVVALGIQVISHAVLLQSTARMVMPATITFAVYWLMFGRHAFLRPKQVVNMDDVGEIVKSDLPGTAAAIGYAVTLLGTVIL